MQRAKYVLTEVLVGLWRNVSMTIAMIITMGVSLFMLGAATLTYLQVNDMKDFYYDKVQISIYLKKDVTDAQKANLDSALSDDPLVKDHFYESRETAYERFKEQFRDAPDLVNSVKPDSMPESFRISLKDPERVAEIDKKYHGVEGIDQIVDQKDLLGKVFSILGSAQTTALIAALVMAVAALLLVLNQIQVAAYSKRREVAVMKLVGASNWFIQAPFVLEAVAAALIGSVLAFLLLVAGKIVLIDGSLKDLTQYLTPLSWTKVILMFPLMAAVGSAVSAITGWITLRFYLRV
ncbi:MAG: ABC transporter permease [Micromonosporaceae bacterium]|nr:ABC transporter permease [Micromonosporaceae bacterium]